MNKASALLWGLAAGAGLMYFYDPDRGNRRRALLRDRMVRMRNDARDTLEAASRDLSNRSYGLWAELTSICSLDPVSDETLAARVRARMGHLISHPRAIQVTANQGRVTLSGPILASEVDTLLNGVAGVRGVMGVENRLEVHAQPDIPSLQGHARRPQAECGFHPAQWSPGARLLASAVGGVLTLYGTRRRGIVGMAVAPLGLGLLTRSLSERDRQQLVSGNVDPLA
jgi:hypothetical protein